VDGRSWPDNKGYSISPEGLKNNTTNLIQDVDVEEATDLDMTNELFDT
jgi:hypothetical protein